MDAGVEAHLQVEGVTIDRRDAELLAAIERAGSLNGAATSLGRSYSRAHSRIETLESALGSLVERERGGESGGGSRLTDAGRELLGRYERLQTALEGTARTATIDLPGRVVDRTGELATVATPAGDVRALFENGDADERVVVTVRADAVVLQDPDGHPDRDATSARNRFRGTVEQLDAGEATATVHVDVGADPRLVVRITTESLERLGLVVGDTVITSFKATATRATPAAGGTESSGGSAGSGGGSGDASGGVSGGVSGGGSGGGTAADPKDRSLSE